MSTSVCVCLSVCENISRTTCTIYTSRTFARTVSSELLGFCFSFPLFFISVPCSRLSWPYRQLLSACKYIVSYHIYRFFVHVAYGHGSVFFQWGGLQEHVITSENDPCKPLISAMSGNVIFGVMKSLEQWYQFRCAYFLVKIETQCCWYTGVDNWMVWAG